MTVKFNLLVLYIKIIILLITRARIVHGMYIRVHTHTQIYTDNKHYNQLQENEHNI